MSGTSIGCGTDDPGNAANDTGGGAIDPDQIQSLLGWTNAVPIDVPGENLVPTTDEGAMLELNGPPGSNSVRPSPFAPPATTSTPKPSPKPSST